MANTLTGLLQYIYDSVDVVSREIVGMIPAVTKNSKAEMVAKNQNITYDIVPAMAPYDVEPAAAVPELDAATVAPGTMAITQSRAVKFHWTGEDETAIGREAKEGIQNNKFAMAFRTLANEMEEDLAQLYVNASRAYGTAAQTPFGTAGNFSDAANVRKILVDNGAPLTDLQLVLNTAAGANLRGYQTQAHMAGASDPLRQGVLLDIHGMQIRESAKIQNHTKGTATLLDTDLTSALAAGATTVHADTGTGTVLAGDVVTFTGDTNKYIVKTGISIDGTDVAEGDFVLQSPGLRLALADGVDISIGSNYAANLAFSRSAIHLLTRLPKMPDGGDAAEDVMIVQDPVSGLYFQVAMYRVYRAVLFEVAIAWGVKAVKPEHMAILLG